MTSTSTRRQLSLWLHPPSLSNFSFWCVWSLSASCREENWTIMNRILFLSGYSRRELNPSFYFWYQCWQRSIFSFRLITAWIRLFAKWLYVAMYTPSSKAIVLPIYFVSRIRTAIWLIARFYISQLWRTWYEGLKNLLLQMIKKYVNGKGIFLSNYSNTVYSVSDNMSLT